MGLFEKIRAEFIDIVEWRDQEPGVLVHRFERDEHEIKMGAQLTVRPGQRAVFVNEGQVADVFEAGRHTLETQNLPILATLKGWKYGFHSPFKAEVYFLNATEQLDRKWGTATPVTTLSEYRGGFTASPPHVRVARPYSDMSSSPDNET